MLLEIIATLAAGLFAGAAIYLDLAEQPARKQIDTAAALTEWRPSYKRAAVVQPILAAVGFLSAIAAGSWVQVHGGWLAGFFSWPSFLIRSLSYSRPTISCSILPLTRTPIWHGDC